MEAQEADERVQPSGWQRFRQLFSREARLHQLNWAVTTYPKAAANYVLRGELLLEQGETEAAVQDFRRALELAGQQLETDAWGVVAQTVQDRALVGLGDALHRRARYNRATDLTDKS